MLLGAASPASVLWTRSFLHTHQAVRFWLVHFPEHWLHFNKVSETSRLLGREISWAYT